MDRSVLEEAAQLQERDVLFCRFSQFGKARQGNVRVPAGRNGPSLETALRKKKCAVGADVLSDLRQRHHLFLSDAGFPAFALDNP
jgi:hypothetical protein